MITAVVEVQGHAECLLVAESLEKLKRQFNDLMRRARTDGYHATLLVLAVELDNSSPAV